MQHNITLINQDHNILVNLDLTNGYKARLLNYLNENHYDLISELEFESGGTIEFTGSEFIISGDNGILNLYEIEIAGC